MAIQDFMSGGENARRRGRLMDRMDPKAGMAYNAGTGVGQFMAEGVNAAINQVPSAIADVGAAGIGAAPGPVGTALRTTAGIAGGVAPFMRGVVGAPSTPAPALPAPAVQSRDMSVIPPQEMATGTYAPPQPAVSAAPAIGSNLPAIQYPTVRAPTVSPVPMPQFGAKGGLFGSMIDFNAQLSGYGNAKAANGAAIQNFNNKIKANEANAKSRSSAVGDVQSGVNLEKSNIELENAATNQQNVKQVADLRNQLAAETDPGKRDALQKKLYAIAGKPQPKYQVVTNEVPSPDGIGTLKQPYIIEEGENGISARPLVQQSTVPAGMKAVGTSGGKPVYEDAKGKRFIGD